MQMATTSRAYQKNYMHTNKVVNSYLSSHADEVIDADRFVKFVHNRTVKYQYRQVFDRHYFARKYRRSFCNNQYFGKDHFSSLSLITGKNLSLTNPNKIMLNERQRAELKDSVVNYVYDLNAVFEQKELKPLTGKDIKNMILEHRKYSKFFEIKSESEIKRYHQRNIKQDRKNRDKYTGYDSFDYGFNF